jgi:hypothetical protein
MSEETDTYVQKTLTFVQSVLDKIEYKPGAKFKCFPADHGVLITLTQMQPSRDDPLDLIEVTGAQEITYYAIDRDEDLILHIVYDMCRTQEIHECAEFFKVNGVRIHDPHKSS